VSRQITDEGKIVGTFAYMSPEQVQGHALDPRSDIFSFGILMYEMVTGGIPFRGNNAIAAFHSIVHEEPKPMATQRDDVPPELERITAKCLAKDPAERYQTAADLAVDLRALHHQSGSGARSYYSSPVQRVAQRRDGSYGRLVRFALAGVAVVALSVVLWRVLSGAPGPEGTALQPLLPPAAAAPFERVATTGEQRNRIAVAMFSNATNNPEADWLRQALPEMLTTDLARSDELQVISTQRMDDLVAAAGRQAGDNLDRATATELARWAGAGVVVSGSIFQAGDGYRIDVQASDTASGEILTASRVEGSDIFSMADQLATELRSGLQVTAVEKQGIEEVTTSSPLAFRHFSAGMKAFQHLQLPQASQAFRASLREDPTFALSQLRLGLSLYLQGEHEEGLEWVARANEQGHRMPERERLLAEGLMRSFHDGDLEAGAEHFQALSEKYPKDVEALFWQAQARANLADDPKQALQLMQEAMSRDPESSLCVAGLATYLDDFQLHDDAKTLVQEFLERHSEISAEQMREIRLHAAPKPTGPTSR